MFDAQLCFKRRSVKQPCQCYSRIINKQTNKYKEPTEDPEIFEGAESNTSALSSFIENTHNQLYAFYTEKGLIKNYGQIGRGHLHRPL